MSAVLATALLAAASPEAAVAEIYAPYSAPTTATASWDYPIFSTQVSNLIAHWRRVAPQDEPDELDDGDWLCLCQDYDRAAFSAVVQSKRQVKGGVQLAIRLDLGHGQHRDLQLILKREGGAWKLDDLYGAPDFPNGLKQKLQEVIIVESMPG
jgi:hypothetical protein